MKKENIPCPITLGEFNRLISNRTIYDKLNDEQKDWLDDFLCRHDFSLKKCVLKLEGGVLWVIINTENSVKQFEDIKGGSRWE